LLHALATAAPEATGGLGLGGSRRSPCRIGRPFECCGGFDAGGFGCLSLAIDETESRERRLTAACD